MADPVQPIGPLAHALDRITDVERRLDAQALETGGGGGNSTGMDARVAKLEAHMEHVRSDTTALKADVGKLKTDIATMLERIAHLPSKGFIVSVVLSASAVLAALAVFGPSIRKLLGLS